MCGSTICVDTRTGQWRRKSKLKMTTINGSVKSPIQWLSHVIQRNADVVTRLVLHWKTEGKRPRDRPRKRWINVVE